MNSVAIAQHDADAIADILGRCQPPFDTAGPGWGPATIQRLQEFAEGAAEGAVQILVAGAPANAAGAFALALATVAESQIGTEEDAAHSNRGAAILKYQEATNLAGQGWAWCAAFVDWCFKQASLQVSTKTPRPQTASAFGEIDWGHENGLHVFTPAQGKPQRGDIVVYSFSHTGIVTGYTGGDSFAAVEGNTNDQGGSDGYEVARRSRPFSQVKAFVRPDG